MRRGNQWMKLASIRFLVAFYRRTYHYEILYITIWWTIRDQKFHSFEFDESRSWSDILLTHDASHLLCYGFGFVKIEFEREKKTFFFRFLCIKNLIGSSARKNAASVANLGKKFQIETDLVEVLGVQHLFCSIMSKWLFYFFCFLWVLIECQLKSLFPHGVDVNLKNHNPKIQLNDYIQSERIYTRCSCRFV